VYVTSEQVEQARALREAGASYAEISRQLTVPPTTVQRNLKPFEPPPDPYETGPSAVAELDPGDVSAEIRLMRSILKKAKDEGASAVVMAQLAKCIGDLSKAWVGSAVRSGKMLHIDTCRAFIDEMGALFVAEFRDLVPDANERIDRIVSAMLLPQNDKRQTYELIGREH
jgi:hypothetical protein